MAFRVFSTELNETNIYEKKSRRPRSQILACLIILVLFKKSSPSEKLAIAKEGPDVRNLDDIRN